MGVLQVVVRSELVPLLMVGARHSIGANPVFTGRDSLLGVLERADLTKRNGFSATQVYLTYVLSVLLFLAGEHVFGA